MARTKQTARIDRNRIAPRLQLSIAELIQNILTIDNVRSLTGAQLRHYLTENGIDCVKNRNAINSIWMQCEENVKQQLLRA